MKTIEDSSGALHTVLVRTVQRNSNVLPFSHMHHQSCDDSCRLWRDIAIALYYGMNGPLALVLVRF